MRRVGKDFSGRPRKTNRKDTQVPQLSVPTESVADEAINGEMSDSLERATTTTTSLDTKKDRGVNTPQSEEDILKLNELMDLCIILQNMVLALEATKTSQPQEIDSLKRRVEKLDKKQSEEDASKQERIIDDLDADEDITLINDQEMFDTDKDLQGKDVVVEQEVVADKEPCVDAAQVSAAATNVTIYDITLAKSLEDLKTSRSKIRGIVIKDHEEPSESRTTKIISSKKSQGKAKAKMIKERMKLKKKDQIFFDEEIARKLQEEINEQERLIEERARQQKEANIVLIETWKDIQAKTELVKESTKKDKAKTAQESSSKRARDELEQESSKKQKIDDDTDTTELKQLVNIISEEDIAIDAIPLVVKTLIVNWKIYKEGKKSYYQIIKAGEKSKNYLVFNHMLKDFDREDVETL
uniref:Uncharacterized protein n=1 Tax=Tanacetum cinerariifolium TaxID=118510 RepID=A0A6L2NA66_TANCI|nr:hypothetical protein [Tanacetum cinerariifolium]